MAREIPAAPRVYTTTYDNFRGVDFTNDATNVWRRRSPTGVNMLPDASGRPFKRHGWDILLSQSDIKTALNTAEDCTIYKCSYFELAGVDHIVVFTDMGVIFYNGEVTAVSTDVDCYSAYDRNFFFEGGGTSAFYIYGNYRMWRYDADFNFAEITDELHIPRVIVSASADGTGTVLESYNLLYNMASVEYHDCDLFTYWGTDGLVFNVDKALFDVAPRTKNYSQTYTYDGVNWLDESEPPLIVDIASIGINVISTPNVDDQITVINVNGLLLPNNVDVTNQAGKVKVYYATVNQWDTEIQVVTDTDDFVTGTCLLHQDGVTRENRQAWIEFYDTYTLDPEQKDVFRVEFPSTEIAVTQIAYTEDGSETATLIGGDA